MGEKISQNWRVLTATLFSVVLVAGAYMLARGIESPRLAEASTETALLRAIATRDSNGDGLPDWQKALYGIPLNSTTTDYFNLGMTDGEAVAKGLIVPKAIADITIATSSPNGDSGAGTLTDAFAKSFFTLYMSAKQANGGVQLSQAQAEELAAQSLSSLSSMAVAAPDYKSAGDLTVSGSGAEALKAFAESAGAILTKNKSDATKNEVLYLYDFYQNNDLTALPHIISIAKMYRDTAVGLAALPVPTELATADLMLINALMRESAIASDFARVNTDPLATMLALSQYVQVGQSFITAFTDISNMYVASGVTLPAGTSGAVFIDVAAVIKTLQQAETTPL